MIVYLIYQELISMKQQVNFGVVHPEPDTVLSYRKTEMLGLSAQTFLGNLFFKS